MRRLLVLPLILAALASAAASPPPVRRMPPPGVKPTPQAKPIPAEPVPQPPASRSSVVTKPQWESIPTGEDLVRYYPEAAQRKGIGGRAVISCRVTAIGTLEACVVESETPPGEGFGIAAVRMASLFKMKPTTDDGAPVEGGTVRIPIVFNPPEPDEADKDGWITTGPPPPLPPQAGRFVYMLDRKASPDGSKPRGGLYLLVPDRPPASGRVIGWLVIVLDVPKGSLGGYVLAEQGFDCDRRAANNAGMQIFSTDGRLQGWSKSDDDWQPVSSRDELLIRGLDLVCGRAQPDSKPFPTLAAVLADARQRFADAKK